MTDDNDLLFQSWHNWGDNFGDGEEEYTPPVPKAGDPEHPAVASLLQAYNVDAKQPDWQSQLGNKMSAPLASEGIHALIDDLAVHTAAILKEAQFTCLPDEPLTLSEVRRRWNELDPYQRNVFLVEAHEFAMEGLGVEPWDVSVFPRVDPQNPTQRTSYLGLAVIARVPETGVLDPTTSSVLLTSDFVMDPSQIVETRLDLLDEYHDSCAAPLLEALPVSPDALYAEAVAARERLDRQMDEEVARSLRGADAETDTSFYAAQFSQGLRTDIHEIGHALHASIAEEPPSGGGRAYQMVEHHCDEDERANVRGMAQVEQHDAKEIGKLLYRRQPKEYWANRFTDGVVRALFEE